jgi:hypothetical protein
MCTSENVCVCVYVCVCACLCVCVCVLCVLCVLPFASSFIMRLSGCAWLLQVMQGFPDMEVHLKDLLYARTNKAARKPTVEHMLAASVIQVLCV